MTAFEDLDGAGKEQSKQEIENEEMPEPAPTKTVEKSTSATTDLSETGPSFPFDEGIQAQIYPRRQTHEDFTDFLDIEVKRLLRDRGIRNEAGRELHEAVLRVAMNHPDEIAEEVCRLRS